MKKIDEAKTLRMLLIDKLPKLKDKYEWTIFDFDARSFSGNITIVNISLFEIRKKQTPLIKEWLISSIYDELPRKEDIPKEALYEQ